MCLCAPQEEKKGGGLFGTVKSLLGGGNNTEAQVCGLSGLLADSFQRIS